MYFRKRTPEGFKCLMDSKAPMLVLPSDSTRASACSLFNVIEADYLQTYDIPLSDDSSITPNILEEDPVMPPSHDDQLDTHSIEVLIVKLSAVFSKNYEVRKRSCRLLVSQEVVRRIAVDVVRMSQLEPQGVEGGRLKVRLAFDGCETELCQISKDDTKDTKKDEFFLYEIILTLSEDNTNWTSLRHLTQLLPTIVCCHLNMPRRQTFVCVGQGYMLEKVKFYSPHTLHPLHYKKEKE